MKRLVCAVWLALLCLAAPAQARDTLTIGLSSFPTQFHPYADPEAVKSYIEGFALRPVTAFDATWHNTCLLCAELPSQDGGTVKIEERPPGLPGMAVTVKLRNTQPPIPAQVFGESGGRARVVLTSAEAAVTPGQACVMYDGDRVLGGGWIERPAAQRPLDQRREAAALGA